MNQYISASTSSGTKANIPSDCKPNINDLRQLFDDNRHCFNNAEIKRHNDKQPNLSQSYFDAKQSHADENIFESKSRNIDFERVKQKFDNPHHRERSSSNKFNNNYNNSKMSNSSKRSSASVDGSMLSGAASNDMQSQKHSLNETIQFFDEHSRSSKREVYSRNSINLDGLKVSEDEDVSS